MSKSSVLFVCLGNICRSPLAEGALRARAEKASVDLVMDSAGTADWHKGKGPDPRACAVAARHGVDISGYQARQVTADDFNRFEFIFALDAQNLSDLQQLAPDDATARLGLLLDLVPGMEGEAVVDPYYGAAAGFDITWTQVDRAAEAILSRIAG